MKELISRVLSSLFFPLSGGESLGGTDFAGLPMSDAGGLLRGFADRLTRGDNTAGADLDDPIPLEDATAPEVFLELGGRLLYRELLALCASDKEAGNALSEAARHLGAPGISPAPAWNKETRRVLWRLFFPEGASLEEDREGSVTRLRNRRLVSIDVPKEAPITDPVRELLFTSNVLITVPADAGAPGLNELPPELRERVLDTMAEPQLYHYDHPIHIGVALEANEAVYGLRGLNGMIAFEKQRGAVAKDAKSTVVLSLSVTHDGLHTVAPDYLRGELARAGEFEHLRVFLFTELECRGIVEALFDSEGEEAVKSVFGVDGEYGRHYSFLKAIAALWQTAVDPGVRGTFKIDLDQVFPQEELVAESGESALEHFVTPLWGARGRDENGNPVELGMIAGALVNEKDIRKGLFTPDVPYPDDISPGESAVFYNRLPMALSTEAEMMTRYDATGDNPDGRRVCLQRFHVTGGTNGILIDALRRYRPFTPTFIGRAEDQCYILSRLYEGSGPFLRYLHKPGLIMRHDKEAFAGEAIEAGRHGRFIGDLVRTYYFSRYAEALSWGFDRIKSEIDPFTGCFATKRAWSVIMLRLVLHCGALAASGKQGEEDALRILRLAAQRLGPVAATELGFGAPGTEDARPRGVEEVRQHYLREREAWGRYYDALDAPVRHPEALMAIIEKSRVL